MKAVDTLLNETQPCSQGACNPSTRVPTTIVTVNTQLFILFKINFLENQLILQ